MQRVQNALFSFNHTWTFSSGKHVQADHNAGGNCVSVRVCACLLLWLFVTHRAFISWQAKNAGEIKFYAKKLWKSVINNV